MPAPAPRGPPPITVPYIRSIGTAHFETALRNAIGWDFRYFREVYCAFCTGKGHKSYECASRNRLDALMAKDKLAYHFGKFKYCAYYRHTLSQKILKGDNISLGKRPAQNSGGSSGASNKRKRP